jgi:hypothetical protein
MRHGAAIDAPFFKPRISTTLNVFFPEHALVAAVFHVNVAAPRLLGYQTRVRFSLSDWWSENRDGKCPPQPIVALTSDSVS